MKVQGRILNTKRHTIGYKIGGKNRSRAEAVRLAKNGKVDGVIIRRGGNDEMHIAGHPSQMSLADLPAKVMPEGLKKHRAARR